MTQLYDAKFFSSRLLGQSRFFDCAGAMIDVEWLGDNEKIANTFAEELNKLLEKLPVKDYEIKTKVYRNGFNIALRYPYDLLMVACEILDWVWADITDLFDLEREVNLKRSIRRFKKIIAENQKLILRKIYNKAQEKKVNFFVNKDTVVLGSGIYQFKAKLNKILKLSDIPWKKIKNIPSVLITGTNGKTTTTRLTEFICRKSGLVSGYCSTDWVMINGKLVSEGDLSGPSGHQFVLSNSKVEVAILEVARGGMVKRGLLPNYATAATMTNIAHDHIGQNGIENLTDLAIAKGIVYNGLSDNGIAIINLDDANIVALPIKHRKSYLSTKLDENSISKYLTADNFVVFIADQEIILKTLTERFILNRIDEIPVTVHGLATYNYENVLHAVALSYSLGVLPKHIIKGLAKFGGDDKSNFGRWNYYHSNKHGHLVVDIAHNPAGLESVLTLTDGFRKLKGLKGKLGLMYGNTADRRETMPEIADIIIRHNIDSVVIKEFQQSLRGSELGEMPEAFKKILFEKGYPAKKIKVIPNEVEAVTHILTKAKPDDMNILCSHELITEVSKLLKDTLKAESL